MIASVDRRSCKAKVAVRCGFTLLEMLTTVAALVIVLGLMVSLARSVRNASAQELTKDLLRKLDALMEQYELRNGGEPAIPPLILTDDPPTTEASLQRRAYLNNRALVTILRSELGLNEEAFGGLPDAVYNDASLRDAWGTPIVYMSSMHPAIGMAPHNRRFFFSAGPDGQLLTQEDNLYSYEEAPAGGRRSKTMAKPSLPGREIH